MFDADVTYFDLTIIGVDVNRLTSQLAMHDAVFVKKYQAFEDFARPVLDDFESRG